ncbi:MAG: ATP-dependent Clp protease adapter ClpS [Candidatus Binataceae bacterium]|nr:ATP-dependent Clp protease adapter ClpS [Candidatus Binataceae bacterium]
MIDTTTVGAPKTVFHLIGSPRRSPTSQGGAINNGSGDDRQGQGGTVTEKRVREQSKTKRPPLYRVILLNDDYTPMEFVVDVLKMVFHKTHAEATRIMLHVHQNGMGVAGVYPFEIAETRVRTVEELARQHEYPLKCVMEKA